MRSQQTHTPKNQATHHQLTQAQQQYQQLEGLSNVVGSILGQLIANFDVIKIPEIVKLQVIPILSGPYSYTQKADLISVLLNSKPLGSNSNAKSFTTLLVKMLQNEIASSDNNSPIAFQRFADLASSKKPVPSGQGEDVQASNTIQLWNIWAFSSVLDDTQFQRLIEMEKFFSRTRELHGPQQHFQCAIAYQHYLRASSLSGIWHLCQARLRLHQVQLSSQSISLDSLITNMFITQLQSRVELYLSSMGAADELSNLNLSLLPKEMRIQIQSQIAYRNSDFNGLQNLMKQLDLKSSLEEAIQVALIAYNMRTLRKDSVADWIILGYLNEIANSDTFFLLSQTHDPLQQARIFTIIHMCIKWNVRGKEDSEINRRIEEEISKRSNPQEED